MRGSDDVGIFVIPAKAGIQVCEALDSRLRGNDGSRLLRRFRFVHELTALDRSLDQLAVLVKGHIQLDGLEAAVGPAAGDQLAHDVDLARVGIVDAQVVEQVDLRGQYLAAAQATYLRFVDPARGGTSGEAEYLARFFENAHNLAHYRREQHKRPRQQRIQRPAPTSSRSCLKRLWKSPISCNDRPATAEISSVWQPGDFRSMR